MDTGKEPLNISQAAVRMGITPEAVRKRINRGTLSATKQDGRWCIVLDDDQDAFGIPSSPSGVGRPVQDAPATGQDAVLDDKDKLIKVLMDELDARRREVQELHVLLQHSQAAIPAPKADRAWWRLWRRQSSWLLLGALGGSA